MKYIKYRYIDEAVSLYSGRSRSSLVCFARNTNTENVVPAITFPIASNPQFIIFPIWLTTLSTVIGGLLVTLIIRFLGFLVSTSLGLLFFFSRSASRCFFFSPFPPFSPSFAVPLLSCPVLVASLPFETLLQLCIFH